MRTFHGSVPITLESRFRLCLPECESTDYRVPLVVALHGFGESGERFAERLSALRAERFAVAFPDAPYPIEVREGDPPKPHRVGFAWYQYTGEATAFARALEFVGAHLDRLIDSIVTRYPIDPRRVVLLGYSQGGYLAAAHALAHPERFAGLIAMATRIKTELFTTEHLERVRFPVLAIHGRRDEHVPLANQRASIERLIAAGIAARLVEHDGGHGLRSESIPIVDEFVASLAGEPRAGSDRAATPQS